MRTKISTGTYVSAPSAGGAVAQPRASDAGVEVAVLFDAMSTSEYSPIFVVRPGEAMLLSSFGMRKGDQAIVEKLRYAANGMPTGGMCEGADRLVGEQTQAEDVTQCGLWVLNPCQNVGVLSLPGTFRLRLNGAAQGSVGTLYIDAMRLKSDEAKLIPMDLFFGHLSGGCK